MKKMVGVCFIVVMAALLPACSGKKGVSSKSYTGIGDDTGRKPVLLLPTISGKGEHYREEDFREAIRERGEGAS